MSCRTREFHCGHWWPPNVLFRTNRRECKRMQKQDACVRALLLPGQKTICGPLEEGKDRASAHFSHTRKMRTGTANTSRTAWGSTHFLRTYRHTFEGAHSRQINEQIWNSRRLFHFFTVKVAKSQRRRYAESLLKREWNKSLLNQK